MSLNDSIIARTESFYSDEFEKAQMHKSSTVGYYWMTYSSIALMPVLAWCLEGNGMWFSLLIFLPIFLGIVVSNDWLGKTVPFPKITSARMWPGEWVFLVVVNVAWLAAFVVKADLGISGASGGLVGFICGMAACAVLFPFFSGRQRKRDLKRLNEQLEAEEV